MLTYLPSKFIEYITTYCDLRSILNLISTNQYFYKICTITNLSYYDSFLLKNGILKQQKFQTLKTLHIVKNINQCDIQNLNLTELYLTCNCNITDLNDMKNLIKLHISAECTITQDAFITLDLVELIVHGLGVTDVSSIKSLQKLTISSKSKIGQNGISGLNLTEFYCYAPNIHDVSFMKNLKVLHICYESGVDQKGIDGLNLIELSLAFNPKVSRLFTIPTLLESTSLMSNLQILDASSDVCMIGQYDIKYLNLVELNANNNYRIRDVRHMTNLQRLCARGKCGINQKGISGLNLVEFDAKNNNKIYTVAYMNKLRLLCICGDCGIDENGIRGLNLIDLCRDKKSRVSEFYCATGWKI